MVIAPVFQPARTLFYSSRAAVITWQTPDASSANNICQACSIAVYRHIPHIRSDLLEISKY